MLQLATSVPPDASRRIASAVAGQLVDLARVERTSTGQGAHPQSLLCGVQVEQSAQGLTLRFVDENGRALAAPRVLAASPRELAASEVATIVRAFVVALLERRSAAGGAAVSATEPAQSTEPVPTPDASLAGRPVAPSAKTAPIPGELAAAAPAGLAAKPAPAPTPPSAAGTASTAGEPLPAEEEGEPRPGAAAPRDEPTQKAAALALWAPARLWLTALYTGSIYAPELSWLDGFRVEGAWRFAAWLYAGISYGFHAPADVPSALATARIRDHNLSVLAGAGRMGQRLGWGIEVVAGVTDTLRETTASAGQLATTGDSTHWSPAGALRLRGRMRVPGLPRLLLELAPAVELGRERPLAVDEGEEIRILSPYTVRGRLDVGATVELF